MLTSGTSEREVPLLKENKIENIVKCLDCMEQHSFNRENQRDCILSIYPNKTEKSVFRGMVIPTLRKTGLILGFENSIRPSANGSIIVKSKKISDPLHNRVLRAVILEIDSKKFNFISELASFGKIGSFISEPKFKEKLASEICGFSYKQKLERISRWLRILKQSGLLVKDTSRNIALNRPDYEQAISDLKIDLVKTEKFEPYILESHSELRQTEAIIDITDLRERVATKLLNTDREILTETQFDELMRRFISGTKKYVVSLGRAMGAEEKLFAYNGKYYRTLTIETVREK